jgi:Sec-independent protein secretion pathway components
MFNIGPQEVLIILIVALIVVGPKRLPELGRTIGRGLNEFKKLQDEVKDMVKFDLGTSPGDAFITPDPVEDPATDEEPEDDPDPTTHSERVVALAGDAETDAHDDKPPVDDTVQDWTEEPLDAPYLHPSEDRDQPPTAAAE